MKFLFRILVSVKKLEIPFFYKESFELLRNGASWEETSAKRPSIIIPLMDLVMSRRPQPLAPFFLPAALLRPYFIFRTSVQEIPAENMQ